MESKRELAIKKYLGLLQDIHHVLSYTKRVSMSDMCKRHEISSTVIGVLKKGGLIQMLKRGKNSEWEWLSIPPNREMTIKTLDKLALYSIEKREIREKLKENADKNEKTQIIDIKPIPFYQIKIFFGLIKINIIPIYGK